MMKDTKTEKNKLRRYLDDMYIREEASQLLESMRDADHKDILDELSAEVWEESVSQQPVTDLEREKYKKEARQLRYMSEQQITFAEISTSFGEKKRVELPDGTILVLNSCSQVRYPDSFQGDIRKVELEGEGYFRVAHNEDMPFIVQTKRLDVRVLGTRFDVKSYSTDEIVSVSVESGKVQVDLPEAMMRLTAKEQVLINTVSGEYSKKKEERGVAVWIKGSLRFNSTPIRDVAKELERVYNCQITFASGQEFDNLITGEHDNKSLESVLKSIEFISDINYKKEGRNILLYKK